MALMTTQLQHLKVQDVMTPNPMRLGEDTPLEEIFRMFSTHSLDCLPVVNPQDQLEGAITISDLEKSRQLFDLKEYISIIVSGLDEDLRRRIAVSFNLEGPIELTAREVMSVRTVKVHPTDTLETVCQQLVELKRYHAMVVNESNHVVGLLSVFDILKRLS